MLCLIFEVNMASKKKSCISVCVSCIYGLTRIKRSDTFGLVGIFGWKIIYFFFFFFLQKSQKSSLLRLRMLGLGVGVVLIRFINHHVKARNIISSASCDVFLKLLICIRFKPLLSNPTQLSLHPVVCKDSDVMRLELCACNNVKWIRLSFL